MVIETDLHFNSRHPDYRQLPVQRLIDAGRAYLIEHGHNAAAIRLVSNRNGEIELAATASRAPACRLDGTSHQLSWRDKFHAMRAID